MTDTLYRSFKSKAAVKRHLAQRKLYVEARAAEAAISAGILLAPLGDVYSRAIEAGPRAALIVKSTSAFGPGAWANLAPGQKVRVPIVGPSEYDRKWYGTATVNHTGELEAIS